MFVDWLEWHVSVYSTNEYKHPKFIIVHGEFSEEYDLDWWAPLYNRFDWKRDLEAYCEDEE